MYSSSAPYAVTTQTTSTQAATSLLDQDGWVAGSGGMRSKNGTALKFTIDTYAAQPDTQTLAVAMQAQLKAVGIDAEISQVPDIDAAQKSPTGWTAALEGDGTVSFSGDPITPLQEYWASDGDSNTTGINDPTLDGLIKTLSTTLDQSDRQQPAASRSSSASATTRTTSSSGRDKPAVVAGPAWKGYAVPVANLWVTATTAPKG